MCQQSRFEICFAPTAPSDAECNIRVESRRYRFNSNHILNELNVRCIGREGRCSGNEAWELHRPAFGKVACDAAIYPFQFSSANSGEFREDVRIPDSAWPDGDVFGFPGRRGSITKQIRSANWASSAISAPANLIKSCHCLRYSFKHVHQNSRRPAAVVGLQTSSSHLKDLLCRLALAPKAPMPRRFTRLRNSFNALKKR